MAAVNMNSIMGKVQAYSRSVEGKLRMKEKIEEYRRNNVRKTAGGSKIVTYTMMSEAADKLIRVMQDTAQKFDLSASVLQHFQALQHSEPHEMPDGSVTISVYFGGDLRRESLEDGEGGHTGEGIDNIVALLNNGAHARDYVYGWWNDHAPTGDALNRSGRSDGFAWVRSKKDREALHFIQQAVNEFNGKYGTEYNVTAAAGEDYI